tara:strand:- start:704 stop:1216 length:513 start_codon:yes stop_codon:yes gene_type:complete
MIKNYKIINILSFILPFFNEISNVLTSSKLSIFRNLYKACIDKFLINENNLQFITPDKLCSSSDVKNKLIIDFIALIGIIIYIGKNSIEYNLLTGIVTGCMMILLSFILPNLFLHKTVHFLMKSLNLKGAVPSIIIGLLCISLLLAASIFLEKLIIKLTKSIVIDPKIEK